MSVSEQYIPDVVSF